MVSKPWKDRQQERGKSFSAFRNKLAEEGKLTATEENNEKNKDKSSFNKNMVQKAIKKTGKMNVLWLMADQLRADTLGYMGHSIVKTPNIDRLAEEGAVFTNSYCSSPVCVPSRATYLTGKYNFSHGVLQNGYSLHKSEKLLPDYYQENGYSTASIGKTHCGRYARTIWEYYDYVEDGYGVTKPSKVPFNPDNFSDITFINKPVDNSDCVLHGKYPAPVEVSKSYLLANEAMKWLYHYDYTEPFLLRVSFDDPHPPVVPPEPYASMYNPEELPDDWFDDNSESINNKTETVRDFWKYKDMDKISPEDHRKHAARYLGFISHLDAQIGRILDYLEELGIADNTIIVLNSDHGHMIGEHRLSHKGIFLYEGVNRVPLIIRHPDEIDSGTRYDDLIEGVDFMPTMLDLIGVDIPEDIQGQSILPILKEEAESRDYVVVQWDDFGYSIRDQRWKLITYDSDEQGELYDLQKDPHEKVNLYQNHDFNEVKQRLIQNLNDWRKKYAK